jgi:hypothetical protein
VHYSFSLNLHPSNQLIPTSFHPLINVVIGRYPNHEWTPPPII